MLWLLLACTSSRAPVAAKPEGWTREAALQPGLTHIDTDKNGRVSKAEYEKVAYEAPPFETLDLDHDGTLGISEVNALLASQDPVAFEAGASAKGKEGFDTKGGAAGFDTKGGAAAPGAQSAATPSASRDRGVTWVVLTVLRDEVRAKDPNATLPSDTEIGTAAASGGLDTPPAKAILATLEAASTKAGLGFPVSLRQKAP